MVNRILRDDPSKGDMHNREGLGLTTICKALKDYHMWPCYMLGLSWILPQIPIAAYLTLQLKAAGFGTFETKFAHDPGLCLVHHHPPLRVLAVREDQRKILAGVD